jgi:hypothetical protein
MPGTGGENIVNELQGENRYSPLQRGCPRILKAACLGKGFRDTGQGKDEGELSWMTISFLEYRKARQNVRWFQARRWESISHQGMIAAEALSQEGKRSQRGGGRRAGRRAEGKEGTRERCEEES